MSSDIAMVSDDLRRQAKDQPDAIVFDYLGRETSYKELDQYASQVAQGLLAAGMKPASRLGFLGKNTDLYFHILCGAQKIRAAMVGINARLAPPEVAFVLNDAGCEILFVGKDFYPVIEKILPDCPQLKTVIAIDGEHGDWQDFASWRDQYEAKDPMLPHEAGDTVIQLYTSGTTGHPKGVELTNSNFSDMYDQASNEWAVWGRGDVILLAMPLFHIAGVNVGLVAIHYGCTAIMTRDVDPGEILSLIESKKIKYMFLVPAVILFLMQHPDIDKTDLSSVREILYGASPIAEELLVSAQKRFQCDFRQVYGLTETTGCATTLPPEAHKGKLLRSCGRPNKGIDLRVVDENGKACDVGKVGEIVMRATTNMKGYWNRPDETKEAMRGGYFHTGDAGYFDEDGWLYIYDRVKDMIVSGGENVYPAEVENALFAHPSVADVAVIGVPDDKWGEAVKAVIVVKPDAQLEGEELIGWARDKIADYKLPKSVDMVEALPRNPSGKILRRELREPYWKGRTRRVS